MSAPRALRCRKWLRPSGSTLILWMDVGVEDLKAKSFANVHYTLVGRDPMRKSDRRANSRENVLIFDL